MSQVKDVSIVLDTYPQTKAIKEGTLSDPDIHLNFTEYKPIRKAFDDMLKDLRFDICEMALVTFLQALDAGKAVKLLPVVMGGEFHHGSLWYNPALGKMTPADLAEMVRSGELAAVIMGTKQGAPQGLERLIPDVDQAISEWFDKHHAVPINHMVVFKADADKEAIHAVYDLLEKGMEQAYPPETRGERFALQCGVKNVWNAVETAVKYSYEQKLISRIFTINEIFDETFL